MGVCTNFNGATGQFAFTSFVIIIGYHFSAFQVEVIKNKTDQLSNYRTVCGRRCRVELSTGRTRSRGYSGPSRRGRPFHPEDRCYECGSRGHYARDCPLYSRGRRR